MNYILFLFIAATVISLLAGLISMAWGKKNNKKLGTKLMTMRVIFQGVAIIIIAIIYFIGTR